MAAGLTYFAEVSDIDTVNESRHQTTSSLQFQTQLLVWFAACLYIQQLQTITSDEVLINSGGNLCLLKAYHIIKTGGTTGEG